jgi:hypothetical protein
MTFHCISHRISATNNADTLSGQEQITMMAAFYKQKPTSDSPYRQLIILARGGGWLVRLSGGTHWLPKQSEELKLIPARSYDDAQKLYDTAYRQLQDEGWKPYSSFDPY